MFVVKEINNLILRIAKNDMDALGELYSMISGHIVAVARSYLLVKADANDVVGDVFAKVHAKAGSFLSFKNGYNWLVTITKNTALNHNRPVIRQVAIENDSPLYDDYNVEDELDKSYNSTYLEKMLSQLDEDEATAIRYKWLENMTVRQIASGMDKKKSTVQDLITRAEKKLQILLKNK